MFGGNSPTASSLRDHTHASYERTYGFPFHALRFCTFWVFDLIKSLVETFIPMACCCFVITADSSPIILLQDIASRSSARWMLLVNGEISGRNRRGAKSLIFLRQRLAFARKRNEEPIPTDFT